MPINDQKISPQLKITGGNYETLTNLINDVAASPTGKALLEQAAAQGYSLSVENIDGMGHCHAKDKRIVLSDKCSYDKMVSSLAHEDRRDEKIPKCAEPYNTPTVI